MSKIQVHCVTSGEETKGWVHTHGMAEYGLPELEIRNVPVFLGVPASTVLRAVCEYMLDSGKRVSLGENMALNEKMAFSFRSAVPISGEDEHYKVERWELIDLLDFCQCEECRATAAKEGKVRQRWHGR